MIGDQWTSRAQAVIADAVRAALDGERIHLPPNAERRFITELAEQLEALGVVIPERS